MIWKQNETIQGGKYTIDKVLGVGGFGVTYQARRLVSGKTVAIKTANDLIQTQNNFAQHQDKFVQEAFRLARCHHPNIVEVRDVCKEGDLWCLIMEYVTGGDLEDYTLENKVLLETEALSYVRQIGSALTYIHQRGLLHRDVKPSNIMLRQDSNEAILIDFGLAREFVNGRTQTHTNARTESYAPIEQYRIRAKRGAYTDVYALAATFYFLITGQQPLPAQFRWQGAELIPPKKHNPLISDRINRIILQGMIVEPEKRPQSIEEWLEEIAEKTPIIEDLGDSGARRRQSEVGAVRDRKYDILTQCLQNKEWARADEETYDLIMKMSQRVKEGWLDYPATQNLSCEVLQTIDRLWLTHSDGRFSFSVQREIWQELGGKIDYNTECLLGEHLGWRVDNNWLSHDLLNCSLEAPIGHFPWNGHLPQGKLKELGLVGSYSRWWSCLILSRCQECNL